MNVRKNLRYGPPQIAIYSLGNLPEKPGSKVFIFIVRHRYLFLLHVGIEIANACFDSGARPVIATVLFTKSLYKTNDYLQILVNFITNNMLYCEVF